MGNFIVTVIVTALRIFALIATNIAQVVSGSDNSVGGVVGFVLSSLAKLAVIIGFNVFMWVWTKLGVLLCMKTSRGNEFEADRFSSNCGYNQELIDAFEMLSMTCGSSKGIFAMLSSSHTDFDSRIARLQALAKAA